MNGMSSGIGNLAMCVNNFTCYGFNTFFFSFYFIINGMGNDTSKQTIENQQMIMQLQQQLLQQQQSHQSHQSHSSVNMISGRKLPVFPLGLDRLSQIPEVQRMVGISQKGCMYMVLKVQGHILMVVECHITTCHHTEHCITFKEYSSHVTTKNMLPYRVYIRHKHWYLHDNKPYARAKPY